VAQSAAERRSAQRRIARELAREREQRGSYRRQTGRTGQRARERARETRTGYLDRMASSRDFRNLSDSEKKSLASAASNSYYGRGNPDWFDAFKEFFYHDKEG
jgi:hypothetical protein